MMKLYRPLCNDVTMRLAVDISPGEDEDVADVQTQFRLASEACDNDKLPEKSHIPDGRRKLSSPSPSTSSSIPSSASSSASSSPFHTRHSRQHHMVVDADSTNHNLPNRSANSRNNAHHHQTSTNRSTSWYSRQNTTDKTAKDIYNHEHGRSTSDFQRVPLDPEFKRVVEEDGNDFKEVSLYDEMGSGGPSLFDELETNGNFERTPTSRKDKRGDVQGGNLNKRSSGRMLDNEGVNDNENGDKRARRCEGASDEDDDEEEDDEDEEFDVCELNAAQGHEELPIDFDEDVDVIDKQVIMSQSMIASYYGEIDEEELQKSMTQSMQVDEIPDEMSKSIAEEIHDVLVDPDIVKDGGEDTDLQHEHQQLPFPYPFTLKHAGHLFEKSRHHFTAMPQSPRSRTPSRSTVIDDTSETSEEASASARTESLSQSDWDGTDTRRVETHAKQIATPQHSPPQHSPPQPSPIRRHRSPSPPPQRRPSPSPQPRPSPPPQIRPSPPPQPRPSPPPQQHKVQSPPPKSAPNKCSVSTMTFVSHLDLEVTHRGLHRFVPRHIDEMSVGIGDPIHVVKESDDLWCEGVNLRTGERGIFPAVYANDLNFLEESDEDEEYWKFNMRFLGSLEVTSHKGDDTLVSAINRVAASYKGNVMVASLSTLEINQYGIRMIDKSKEGHEKDAFSHFFALKNISFCGTHPKNNRYFAFITKHPREYKFACHVFHGDRPTHRARDALGEAFKRFYQEYMAFTHPTEDIYME